MINEKFETGETDKPEEAGDSFRFFLKQYLIWSKISRKSLTKVFLSNNAEALLKNNVFINNAIS